MKIFVFMNICLDCQNPRWEPDSFNCKRELKKGVHIHTHVGENLDYIFKFPTDEKNSLKYIQNEIRMMKNLNDELDPEGALKIIKLRELFLFPDKETNALVPCLMFRCYPMGSLDSQITFKGFSTKRTLKILMQLFQGLSFLKKMRSSIEISNLKILY